MKAVQNWSLSLLFPSPRQLQRASSLTHMVKDAVRQSGFTLLEILTAMALFFMVAGILVSGVAQAIRVAEAGATESANARDQAMRLSWFRETIGLSVLPPPSSKLAPPPPLLGDARSIKGLSINVPNARSHGPTAYKIDIVFNAESGESQLRLESLLETPLTQKDPNSVGVLAAWRGSEGRFFFLDEAGVWRDRWPVLDAASTDGQKKLPLTSPLPKAIEFQYGTPARSVIAAIQDRSIPPPSLAELMQ
jgi:type II secretory pathway pseudopilin PulG